MANRISLFGSGRGPGSVPDVVCRHTVSAGDPILLATGDSFTVATVNCTPAVNCIGGVPALQLAGAGGATDGYQIQYTGDAIRPQPSKPLRMAGFIRSADWTHHNFTLGFNAVDTTIIASDSTDFLHIQAASSGLFVGRARKASGAAQTTTFGHPVLVNDSWYFFEIVLVRDASTAGKGRMTFYLSDPNPAAGASPTYIQAWDVPTQFADTVDLAPAFAWQGVSVTTLGHLGQWGFEQEF